jgi:hypothetical protein
MKFKSLALFFASCLFSLFIGELGTRLLCHVPWGEKYCRFDLPESRDLDKFWIQGYDKDFGVWHGPQVKARHRKSCVDVTYTSNSYGARDRERQKNVFHAPNATASKRVIVLGDSWVEGMGAPDDKTIPADLEKRSSLEHLNFGTSGYNSPLDYLLRYQALAKKFDHDVVMVGILPFNDFDDMNLDVGKVLHTEMYRPYLAGKYPGMSIEYFNPQAKSVSGNPLNRASAWLRQRSYLFALYAHIKYGYISSFAPSRPHYKRGEIAKGEDAKWEEISSLNWDSAYYSFSEEDWQRLQWVLEQFLKEAQKEIVFVSFPTIADFKVFGKMGAPAPFSEKMRDFMEKQTRKDIFYLDLLPLMYNFNPNQESYFPSCDGHLNPYGNEVASELIYQNLKGKIY